MSTHMEEIRDRISTLRELDTNLMSPDETRDYIADLFATVADELERLEKEKRTS
jgi:hypothetical protein